MWKMKNVKHMSSGQGLCDSSSHDVLQCMISCVCCVCAHVLMVWYTVAISLILLLTSFFAKVGMFDESIFAFAQRTLSILQHGSV